jgi:hypothetical protein
MLSSSKGIPYRDRPQPLIPLLGTKHLDSLPPRILRFRLRLARYLYIIEHVSGKTLYTADALARATLNTTETGDLPDEVESFVGEMIKAMSTSNGNLRRYKEVQAKDPICVQLIEYCQTGWPKKCPKETHIVPYFTVKGSLTVHEETLLYNSRIVIPPSLRLETLKRIHEGHQGIARCRARATSVYGGQKLSRISNKWYINVPLVQRECDKAQNHLCRRSCQTTHGRQWNVI